MSKALPKGGSAWCYVSGYERPALAGPPLNGAFAPLRGDMLGTFTVHAGDFAKGREHQLLAGKLIMKVGGKFFRETIPVTQIELIEKASEEAVKRVGGTLGWGIAGAVLLGPVGMLAGLMLGGKGKDVTFVCRLKDGRKFLATASAKMFVELAGDDLDGFLVTRA